MTPKRRLATILAGSALALTAIAAPASAQWFTPSDVTTNAALRVDSVASVSKDGFSVTWPIQFTCPAGESYTLSRYVTELNPPAIPDLAGEDGGITARDEVTGTCTGHNQNVRTPINVVPTTYVVRATGEVVTVLVPIGPATPPFTGSAAVLSTSTGFAQWCSAPNCADVSGPRITIR